MPLRSMFFLAVGSLLCCIFTATKATQLASHPGFDVQSEPGGSPADANTAMNHPDDYAWALFFFLNRQADSSLAGKPDLQKKNLNDYDPDTPVVWETWALASGEQFSEAFPCDGSMPQKWEDLAQNDKGKPELQKDPKSGKLLSPIDTANSIPFGFRSLPHPPGVEGQEEVRMNRANYNTIRDQGLWNQEGIQDGALQAKKCVKSSFVDFPLDAKEIKAVWVHLTDCDQLPNSKCDIEKSHFHWRTITSLGLPQVWGLAALHLMTKDIQPNWFWADFIQADCLSNFPKQGPSSGYCPPSGHEADAFVQSPIDSSIYAGGITSDAPGKNKWHYYQLMGTETGFDSPPVSDPLIETAKKKSSCITCHAYAATTDSFPIPYTSSFPLPSPLPPPNALPQSSDASIHLTGIPDEGRFFSPTSGAIPGQRLYFGSDFEWSPLEHVQSATSGGNCGNRIPKSVPRQVRPLLPCTAQ
jgi:hypothetical protein